MQAEWQNVREWKFEQTDKKKHTHKVEEANVEQYKM